MKYLGYYSLKDECERNACLSAHTMMDYIAEAFVNAGQSVELVSASMIADKKCPASARKLENGVNVRFFSAKKVTGLLSKLLYKIRFNITLANYLLFHTKPDEPVVVYHSRNYMKIVSFAKRIKRFRLILEVNEIYADVIGNEKARRKEMKYFKKADAYMFSTSLLNDKINTEEKPWAVIPGTFKAEDKRKLIFNDEKIHLVYAGTLDPRKGALEAVKAAEHLDSRYHIHILGFGHDEDIELMKSTVADVNSKSECKATYEGTRSGEEYIRFIQSCHVGFSTQSPDADFNSTSFPSKILSYMSNGLRVVSIRIPAIENSAVGQYINFYDEQTPEKIADAIKKIDFDDGMDSREIIDRLNKETIQKLKKIAIKEN